MIINRRKKKLIEKLKDKEHRDAFVEESINVGIPFQIKALREQRGWTQKDFEKHSGMKQALISRWENPNYSKFSLSTLKKIASIFDIGLIIRFVPISDLVKWELNLNTESLKAFSFDEDTYFKEEPEEALVIQSLIPGEESKQCLGITDLNEWQKERKSTELKKQAENILKPKKLQKSRAIL